MTDREQLQRLEELAVTRLLDGLSHEERQEYRELEQLSGICDLEAIERTVAIAHLSLLGPLEQMPEKLQRAIQAEAEGHIAGPRRAGSYPGKQPPGRRLVWAATAGWLTALAASCAALFLFVDRPAALRSPPPVPVVSSRPPQVPPARAASQVAPPKGAALIVGPSMDSLTQRRALLASHLHAIQRPWRAGGDGTGERVRGEVVWDEDSQTGYMRFVNLRRNEPNAEQYQLWIFDGTRDERFPVDGGVFDIPRRDGEVIVPIHAKLRVRVPLAFAITVERPGGVVVSDRSRVAAIANIS